MRWQVLRLWQWLCDTWELWRSPIRYRAADHVDVQDPGRRQAIRDFEHAARADAASKVQRVSGQPTAHARHGHLVRFVTRGANLGYPSYDVISQRGEFVLGKIEFRNQWGSYAYYPESDGVYNQQVLAEIYAMLRELKQQ